MRRVIAAEHKARIAQLPCVICSASPVHVAHVRYTSRDDGAEQPGMGRKPDDWRVVPLCPRHHQTGRDAQHSMGEERFWREHGINPYALARALYGLTDLWEMERLVLNARGLYPTSG